MITPDPVQSLPGRPFHVLMVCTANQARSPLAEVISRDALARRGIDGWVTSAGLLAGGRPAAREAVRVAAERGFDLSRHVSRQVDEDMLVRADLVVTMEVRHIAELAIRYPGSQNRLMTLPELASRAGSGPMAIDEVHRWVQRNAGSRRTEWMLGRRDLDVIDPAGRGRRAFRRTATEIAGLVDQVFDRWFGPASDLGSAGPISRR
jgi:protein-tyrosine phosphatase